MPMCEPSWTPSFTLMEPNMLQNLDGDRFQIACDVPHRTLSLPVAGQHRTTQGTDHGFRRGFDHFDGFHTEIVGPDLPRDRHTMEASPKRARIIALSTKSWFQTRMCLMPVMRFRGKISCSTPTRLRYIARASATVDPMFVPSVKKTASEAHVASDHLSHPIPSRGM